jgi:hypothetical protein
MAAHDAKQIASESAYLKDDLGPVLAKGLAAVAVARPTDPVEYLGLWLLHYLQQKERRIQEVEAARQLEGEREAWAKGRAAREKSATAIIQREWKAHVRAGQEAIRKEAALRKRFLEIEDTLDEQFPEEPLPEGVERTEHEKEAEVARMVAENAFKRQRVFVLQLDKGSVADFKFIPSSNTSAVTLLKCCFYLMGLRPKQLDSWEKIRALIKPYPFTVWLEQFHPCGQVLEKKRKMVRVRRLLTTISPEAIDKQGPALHAVHQWALAASNFREARDEHIRARRAAGRELEEEYDDEEEIEDEEKDADEESIKARELEEQRQAEAEAAADADAAEEES